MSIQATFFGTRLSNIICEQSKLMVRLGVGELFGISSKLRKTLVSCLTFVSNFSMKESLLHECASIGAHTPRKIWLKSLNHQPLS